MSRNVVCTSFQCCRDVGKLQADVQDVNAYIPEALILPQRSKSHQWHTCVNLSQEILIAVEMH